MSKIKQLKYILFFLFAALITSCEELIDVELNSANPNLVAEGVIELGEPVWLRLSYTSDYFSKGTTEFYEYSTAVITDENGNSEILQYEGDGLYCGSEILGEKNTNYTLNFTEGKSSYEASSTLFPPVAIKQVSFNKTRIQTLEENRTAYKINIVYRNNPNQNNYYLFRFYVDGELQNNWYSLANSSYYPDDSFLVYQPAHVYFDKGDKVRVVAYTLDEATYNYYSQLNDLLGSDLENTSTPYNPRSNFGDNVLGYFAAWSYDTFEAEVK
ncbi:hypothetical protein OU798_17910 [Prolixibacteraceae bacterium Z1-6]|uniref:DUF4249 domain-containing protein n=1 Tax=Draconibacterium aestuarii TaxID=2998507 RepID=A0A9X3J643_9BACT|nr:hypothetical protein [Prolixibacteraceae bacterium Z1-6]